MNQPDTLQLLNDSTRSFAADSLAKIDSLARVDSIRAVDSIKSIVPLPTGFVGIPHPSLPQTETWVFVTLFLLFILFVFSLSRSSGFINDTIKNFFQVKERSSIFSKATINETRIRLILVLFSIAVLSLYLYLILYQTPNPFLFSKYAFILLITMLFFGFKSLMFELIGYVFLNPSSFKMAKDSYFNIVAFLGIVLFPLMILQIYIPTLFIKTIIILSLIIGICTFILVIIKLFQIFFHKTEAFFYILLYLCTLEILPLIALYQVYKLIV